MINRSHDLGVDGVLVVDIPGELSLEDYGIDNQDLDVISLVSPTTSKDRVKEIVKNSTGFIYYVTLRGVTGSSNLDGNEIEKVQELTKGKGSEAVIDFVGEKGSTAMGIQMTSNGGFYYIVGYGEEIKSLAVDLIISEKTIVGNLVGTWSELYELMELADRGKVKLSMQEYKLDDANKALHDLNDGKVKGRAVLVP